MKLLLYCTKAKPYLTRNDLPNEKGEFYKHWQLGGELDKKHLYGDTPILNGKIVAECDYEVEEIKINLFTYKTDTLGFAELCEKSCLDFDKMYAYFLNENKKAKINEVVGYAIHINNLHIFDEPKELSDYYTFNGIVNDVNNWKPIEKAPQNMMYAYELISELGLSGTYNMQLRKNILISIRPEWLCKILNGEKKIEVRKKVLKEMLK